MTGYSDGMREALEFMAKDGCHSFTTGIGSCYRNGRCPKAEYLADRVCDACFASAALSTQPSDLDDAALREVLAEEFHNLSLTSMSNRVNMRPPSDPGEDAIIAAALAAMRRVSTPAQQVTEQRAWEILRPRITGFGEDHGDGHFDDGCERCALIAELDAALSPKPQQE